MVHELNDESFRQAYRNHSIVVVDFWAIWCGPCHQFAPIFEQVAGEQSDIFFGKVDTEAQLELSQYFGIRSIPTLVIIRDGIEVFRQSGVMGHQDLTQVLEQVQALDMEKVKAQLEAEEPT